MCVSGWEERNGWVYLPFPKESSHIQPSTESALKCFSCQVPQDVCKHTWRRGEWMPCLYTLGPVCLQVHLPAVREPAPADLLFSDFQTLVVNAAWDWTSKGITDTSVWGRHESVQVVTSEQRKLGLTFRKCWPLKSLRPLDEGCYRSVKYCNQGSDNGFFTCNFVISFILCKVNCSMCLQAILI